MAKGFVKFVCKVEGKEPSVPTKAKTSLPEVYQCWPGEITDYGNFRELIQEVLYVGVGGSFEPDLLDHSFVWDSHSLESDFVECYESEVVSSTLYEYCLWADQNLDSMSSEEEYEVMGTPW